MNTARQRILAHNASLNFFDDGTGEVFLDLPVTRYRLAHFRAGILIPVVLAAVPDEDATHLRELLDERDPLHET